MTAAADVAGLACKLCHHKAAPGMPLGMNEFFECSHVDCPNRHQVTAQPSDRVPPPKEKQ